MGSDSWIKGKQQAIDYCNKNNLDYEVVWEKSYEENKKIYNELTLYFSVKKHLDQLVLQKLMKNKIEKFGADKR